MLTRRGLLARVGQCAPLIAAGGVLGRLALPMQMLTPKATVIAQDVDEVPPHPALIEEIGGESVYDYALITRQVTDRATWIIRAPGQFWRDAVDIGDRASVLVRMGNGQLARLFLDDRRAVQWLDDVR